MKHHTEWPRWTPLWIAMAVIMVYLSFVFQEARGADYKPPAFWGEGIDSAKWFVTVEGGTHWDSTAGAARADCARYDTTFTGLSNDTAYWFALNMWDASDSAKSWLFYRAPVGVASISSSDKGEIAALVEDTLKGYHGAGPWGTGTGSGSNAVTYYALDTSTDHMIIGVSITIKTIAGVFDAVQTTNASGYVDFTLPTDSMVAYGWKGGYYFFYDTNNVTGNFTDTLIGYAVPVGAPSSPNLCRVYGYVYGPSGLINNAVVTATLMDANVYNNCDTGFFIAETKTETTDTLGYFYFDLLYSSCLLTVEGDSVQYEIVATKKGIEGKKALITVPDASSYEVEW